MFNIEMKYLVLAEKLDMNGAGNPVTDIDEVAEELGSEMDTMTEALTTMYFQLSDIEDACVDGTLASEFPYVQGLGDLDENAAEVVRDLMTELAANLMTSIRDLTRFDRVDRR